MTASEDTKMQKVETLGEPDMRYVSQPASDAACQIANPVNYPVQLYPELDPYASGHLDVGDGHELYWEQC